MRKFKTSQKRNLTAKQSRFLKELVTLPSPTWKEAACRAGYSPSYANHAGTEILKRPAVRVHLREIMEKLGLSGEVLIQKLKEGLNAKVTRIFAHEGKLIYSKDLIDYSTRHKYLETALKCRGDFKLEAPTQNVSMAIIIEAMRRGAKERGLPV